MRHVAAVSVNHNTSLYTELMLRSLFATHSSIEDLGLSLTILDNESEDDASTLRAYAAHVGVPILPSGFTTHTQHNSHGELLRQFVLDHPDVTHYLFLDTDAVFSQPDAIATMAEELDAAPDGVFAIGARMGRPWNSTEEVTDFANLYERRLHPFCALFRNTPLFQSVADQVGFPCVRYLWAERDQYLDTSELLSVVMRTFGYRYLRSSAMVGHFFAVSYDMYGEAHARHHAERRDILLAALRAEHALPTAAPPAPSAP